MKTGFEIKNDERPAAPSGVDRDIVSPAEPVDGAAYRAIVEKLYGSWNGDLFEPLDPPLKELGPLFD